MYTWVTFSIDISRLILIKFFIIIKLLVYYTISSFFNVFNEAVQMKIVMDFNCFYKKNIIP